jgi:hypothetical protein
MSLAYERIDLKPCPIQQDAVRASLRATAPAATAFHGLAFLRGGMTATAPRVALVRVQDAWKKIKIRQASIDLTILFSGLNSSDVTPPAAT